MPHSLKVMWHFLIIFDTSVLQSTNLKVKCTLLREAATKTQLWQQKNNNTKLQVFSKRSSSSSGWGTKTLGMQPRLLCAPNFLFLWHTAKCILGTGCSPQFGSLRRGVKVSSFWGKEARLYYIESLNIVLLNNAALHTAQVKQTFANSKTFWILRAPSLHWKNWNIKWLLKHLQT